MVDLKKDKNFYTNHIMDKKIKKTIKNFVDSLIIVEKTNRPWLSNFLNPKEQQYADSILKEFEFFHVEKIKGDDAAERSIIAINMSMEEIEENLVILKIEGINESVTHRDVLGAILALGVQREEMGDIVMLEDSAEVLLKEDIASMVEYGLSLIGKTPVTLSRKKGLSFEKVEVNTIKKRASIASLRLDVVLAEILNLSRSKSKQLIHSKAVKVNYERCTKVDYMIKAGDLISIRGYGRTIFKEVEGTTKKDRLWICYEQIV